MSVNLKQYTVVIIEPSEIVELGIRRFLENSDFEVIWSFKDYHSFNKDYFKGTSPDIILINPTVLQPHKQFLIRKFFPDFIETVFVSLLYSYVAFETTAGFDGSISIYDDRVAILRKLKSLVVSPPKLDKTQELEITILSKREKEILTMVVKGLTSKEIAETLKISIHTVISHRKNIAHKTGVKTISGLLMYALFNKLISLEEIQ